MASQFVPEAAIDKDEAGRLAAALAAVNAHYAHVVNPKLVAWVNLASVGAGIYGPRLVAFGVRRRMQKQAARPRMGIVPTPAPVKPAAPTAPAAPAQERAKVVPMPAPLPAELRAVYADPAFVPDMSGVEE